MPAARLNMEVPLNGTWRKTLRHRQQAPTSQEPNRKLPTDLTGYEALLQARPDVDGELLFTISTRVSDDPDATIPALDDTGVVSWVLNVAALNLTVQRALYELVLIDPDGNPDPLLEGQLEFTQGVVQP
jgi:hypothetical protein